MSDLTRREFFQRFANNLTDQVDMTAVKTLVSRVLPWRSRPDVSEWFAIGATAEMKPGAQYKVRVQELELTVISTPVGVSALRGDGQCLALRCGKYGMIEVNPFLEWPRLRVLGHLSGEPIDTIEPQQERNHE